MSGGGGGMFGANSPLFAKAVQQNTPSNAGVAYTPIQQGPRYTPQYQQFQQTASPTLQNSLGPKYAPQQVNGIQSLYNMFSSPMQQNRGLSQLNPMQPYVGSTYRPSMAQPNLNRVAPSVELQQRLAAEAEAKRAAEEAANKPSSQGAIPTGYDNG